MSNQHSSSGGGDGGGSSDRYVDLFYLLYILAFKYYRFEM